MHTMPAMVTRIGPAKPPRNFLKAWREKRGLTQEVLAERLETNKAQISNWENQRRDISGRIQAALEHALGIDPGDLFRDPERPSADDLLRHQPPEVREEALDLIRFLIDRRRA